MKAYRGSRGVVTKGVVSTLLSPIYVVPKPSGKFGASLLWPLKQPILEFPREQGIDGCNSQIRGFLVI